LVLPAGVPADAMATLDKTMGVIAKNPEFQKAIENQGLDVTYMNAKDATAFWNSEIEKWVAVIKAADVKAE
jgi:tripartite-type tricarboxylate transporter receptor subunit TctC